MAKIACKNRGQERGNEASDISKPQTEKFPSTTLKRDQKYEYLQYMAASKSVYKHDRKVMQKKAQKKAITRSIQKNHQTEKKC